MVAHGERSSPSGQELLAEFVQYGHQKPFEEIVRRYAGMVFNVCVRITKDKHEAEDATQAVFLTLALQAKRGTEIKALGPWLQQVAKRLSLDLRRSKKRRKTREERHQEEQTLRRESILGDTLPSADLDELKTVLHEELQKLPAKYRLPLILHYFGGLTRDEMATELGCKASTLGVRIFRGREMLAGRLSGRGINISAGALAIALGYTVQRAISDALVHSTSYAASALMAGHDGGGLASAQVIGLTRRASSALALGKVKIAALTLMIAGTSLGASVKAMDMIPAIDVRQMISNQVQRMVRPLFAPFSTPMRADAQIRPAPVTTVASTTPQPIYASEYLTTAVQSTPSRASAVAAKPPVAGSSVPPLTVVTPNSQMPASRSTWIDPGPGRSEDSSIALAPASDDHDSASATAKSSDVADASTSGASAGGSAGAGGGNDAGDVGGGRRSSDSTVSHTTAAALPTPLVIATSNNLIVAPALNKTSKTSKTTDGSSTTGTSTTGSTGSTAVSTYSATNTVAGDTGSSTTTAGTSTTTGASAGTSTATMASTPQQIVQIPATNGTVTYSNGIVTGYGSVPLTGIVDNNGEVVANGNGVNRTLNFPAIKGIQKDITNAAAGGGTNGWYAVNHGRLSLPLIAGASPASLTWGESSTATTLDLVNSVRLTLQSNETAPSSLSLLSPDRSDVPDLTGINGAPIGLWEVSPSAGSIMGADISIRYNDTLVDELGASESAVTLWTLCSATDSWTPVDPTTFSLDIADHTVDGYGTDFSYFAVAVPPAAGSDSTYLVAHPQSEVASVVPEPVGTGTLLLGGLLLRRRRKITLR